VTGAKEESTVLLVGPEAQSLTPRLEISGYRPLSEQDGGDPSTALAPPQAVILSPGWESRIPPLRDRWGAVPMLLGIEHDSVAGRSHCLASGADDFWLTGLGPSDLLMRLRLHLSLGRPSAPNQPLLQVGDLSLDPESSRVHRGTRQLSLTAREYQLLLLLLRHRGEVVSRERILREIWDDQQAAASNVIEVYVRYLRQKLEADGERRLLHTVRGRGYCLGERLPQRDSGG
jgi:two-component system response regulator MprA